MISRDFSHAYRKYRFGDYASCRRLYRRRSPLIEAALGGRFPVGVVTCPKALTNPLDPALVKPLFKTTTGRGLAIP
jgi:dihydrodipicolinate synthase/N-acetylneuraminate lyase